MSDAFITLHARGTTASRWDNLVELGLLQEHDGFLELALVKLDLLFEREPGRRKKLLGMEQILEEMERMDWPVAPVRRFTRPRGGDRGVQTTGAVELAADDLYVPNRIRGHRTLHARSGDPRASV